jgi:hypothetical protein
MIPGMISMVQKTGFQTPLKSCFFPFIRSSSFAGNEHGPRTPPARLSPREIRLSSVADDIPGPGRYFILSGMIPDELFHRSSHYQVPEYQVFPSPERKGTEIFNIRNSILTLE